VERAALDQCADLVHFRGSEDRGHRPIHVSRLLPFFLVLEQSLLHRLDLADLRRGASIASGHAGVGVHREREITMNQINLSGADVVVHEQDRKSTRLNSSHVSISYAVFCLKKKKY